MGKIVPIPVLPDGTVVISLRNMQMMMVATSTDRLMIVDRRSVWGNPFKIGIHGSRDEVVDRYRDEHLPSRPDLLARLPELKGKALACWCHPLRCHGDVLAAMAEAA